MHLEGSIYIRYGGFDSSMEEFLSFIVKNWFLRTDAENDDMMIVLRSFGIPPKNLYVIPECVRNLHHLYQLPECLAAVYLVMSLVSRG